MNSKKNKIILGIMLGSTLISPFAPVMQNTVHAIPKAQLKPLEITKEMKLIVNNYGYPLDPKKSKITKNNYGQIYVPVRDFAKAIGAELYWSKDYPLRVILQKNNREFVFWYGNSVALSNNRATWMKMPSYIENGQMYCAVEPIAEALNLLVAEESDYLDVTTEDQYENDKMVNAAMKPYEDIRFLIQKHGDNPMGGRQEAVWNFSRKAKDTRNRLVNRKPYDGVDYTKDMDHFKKYGPWQYWMIIGPTTDYTVFKKSGEQVTINGAALRLSKSGETAPTTIEREITEYMQKNNYPVPSPSSTMKYLAHVKSVEVAKAFYDGSIDPKNTRTLVNIDDYVEPRTRGTYIPDDNKKEDKKDDKNTKNEQNNKEENKESNKENKQENNDKPTTNNNPKNETKSTPISAKTELGMREMPMSSGEVIVVETMAESESDNVKQDPRRYRVYTTGNNGHDTYQDSVGITRFRREFTVIQPLHTENASSVVDQALSNYDIFRSLITKESEMGAASFSFKDKEGNWYEVSTIVAGNIHGLLPMDIEHGINDYLTNIDSMKREKQLQDNDKDKKEENDKKALEELKKKNNKNN